MVIAAYAGTGKTTLANLYPEKIVDFVCMPYKYLLDDNDGGEADEANKANPDHIMQDDWPFNYVSAIKQSLSCGKTLLIPSDRYVLWHLRDEEIPYTLCYPRRDAKEVYRKRFLARGNTQRFIEIFIDCWDNYMDGLERDSYGRHIVLRPDQFLSDVVDVGGRAGAFGCAKGQFWMADDFDAPLEEFRDYM